MTKDRRLGRGLAALLGTPLEEGGTAPGPFIDEGPLDHGPGTDPYDSQPAPDQSPGEPESSPDSRDVAETVGGDLLQLNVHEIEQNPFQPRREFSPTEISSLAESLKEHDMLQPVLVRRVGDRFQLISGERRLRAAIEAGWTSIPARLRDADDRLVAELAIVENLQRKDLNPIEKALSFKRYVDEHGCTQEELARRLTIDRSTIANLMRLLELPIAVRESLQAGTVTAGHARALLPLGDEKLQVEFCKRIQQEGTSVREVERLVQERIREEDDEPFSPIAGVIGKPRTVNVQIESLEQKLRAALGTKVEIKQGSRGRGKIVIQFGNHDEFERIWQYLTDDGSDANEHVG